MFKFAKVHADASIPKKAHIYDAGFDLAACEEVIIGVNEQKMINTGIAIHIPIDCYARVAPRSGLAAKKCIDVMAGVVDHGYSDSIRVILRNHGTEPFEVKIGDRIAQLILERIYIPDIIEEVSYDEIVESNFVTTTRGTGGFGSTDI